MNNVKVFRPSTGGGWSVAWRECEGAPLHFSWNSEWELAMERANRIAKRQEAGQ